MMKRNLKYAVCVIPLVILSTLLVEYLRINHGLSGIFRLVLPFLLGVVSHFVSYWISHD